MAAFEYLALDTQGHRKKGVIEGDAPRQIRQKLREMGLLALDIKPVEKNHRLVSSSKSLSDTDLSLFTRQLATLLSAGMPVEEALYTITGQTEKNSVKKIVSAVHAHVQEGYSLANALSLFPKAFSGLYCATIAAGEQSGHLEKILEQLAEYVERQRTVHQKIQQGLIYPIVMLIISFSILGFLLTYVVPKIVGIFNDMGQELPVLTKILLNISGFLQHYGIWVLIILILFIFLFRKLLQNHQFRFQYQKLLLHMPLIGRLIKISNTAQFARTFGILTSAGVTALEAMRIAAAVIVSLPIQESVLVAAQRVREGAPIHRALKQTNYFTLMGVHLIASGETSGRLAEMLEKVADYQEQEVFRVIETGLALFEPLLIVLMGSMVLFIVLAILLPIFSLNQLVT